jgi:hypothetical protein
MVYDGICCYFLSTCQVECHRDLVVYFTMFMPIFLKKFKSFKWHDCCKFLSLIIHFTLKTLIFRMDFLINHMFRDIHKVAY